jgi:hypothetical protein
MNFSSLSDPFIPLLKTNKISGLERNYELILLSLYEDLLEGEKVVKILSQTKESIDTIRLTNNSNFFPKPIRNYIKNTNASLYEFKSNVLEREININFYSFNDTVVKPDDLEKYTKMMLTWLYICLKYSHKKCAKEMVIQVYLTPFKKILPINNSIVLSPENVNTAFTMSCVADGEIIIFREEEWFKVFIHETFHAYGLDFGMTDSKHLFTILKKTFPIKSEFSANEAYAETWARIINCALFSFFTIHNRKETVINKENFLLYTDFSLQLERLFAIYQMNKVLNFMGLNYTDLYEVSERSRYLREQLYKENTHVFGYYILTAIFLNGYRQFITWCHANNAVMGANNAVIYTNNKNINNNFMKFNCEDKSFQKIGEYIKSMYKNKDLSKVIEVIHKLKINNNKYKELLNTTRMTVVDIKYIF